MTTTTMHFGPEWMRTKQLPSRTQIRPSSPPTTTAVHPPSGASTYSALVSPPPATQPEKRDEAHPFKYSREELLRIYKEGGGRGGLGLEVERWEGVVREVGSEPVGLREMSEAEKKVFAGSLNSEVRRRQSTDFLSPLPTPAVTGERSRLNSNTSAVSPLRERFGSLIRRKDDQPSLTIPRRSSLSSGSVPVPSPRESSQPSPRTRIPFSPSFDGVLSGGDTWAARRRYSEGLQKGVKGEASGSGGEGQQEGKEEDIKEEDEEVSKDNKDTEPSPAVIDDGLDSVHQPESPRPQPEPSCNPAPNGPSKESPEVQVANVGIRNLSLASETSAKESGTPGKEESATAITVHDLASIEWSYLDPQGQVQGPFRADLMQKWHDEGYFTSDLLMKRTHMDTEWVPVGELGRRSGGDKIFLSMPTASVPPGLSRRTESPLQTLAPPSGPYQPAPGRPLRASTLESYHGSNPNLSESPSSSFGTGRFGNGSPDPATFGGLPTSNHYSSLDSPVGTRTAAVFSAAPDSTPAFATSVRRNTSRDPLVEAPLNFRSSFGNMAPGRTSSVDSFGFNGPYTSQPPSWQIPSTNLVSSSFEGMTSNRSVAELDQLPSNFVSSSHSGMSLPQQIGFGSSRSVQEAPFGDNGSGSYPGSDYAISDFGNQRDPQLLLRSNVDAELPVTSGFNSYVDGYSQPYAPPSVAYSTPQALPSLSSRFGQHESNPISVPSNPHVANSNPPPPSPWNTQEQSSTRRPGPFDSILPPSANTIVTAPQPSSWNRPSQPPHTPSLPAEPSPWFLASQGVVDENWMDISGPSNVTFRNVGQHSHPPRETEDGVANTLEVPGQLHQPPSAPPPPIISPVVTSAPAPTKSRRKSTTQLIQTPVFTSKPTSSGPIIVKSPTPPIPMQPKAAWLSEDDKKSQPSGISVNLREIQEAEEKKAEARKAAEQGRERLLRASASLPVGNDLAPFTASWGLPTSQAGAARNNVPQKEPPAATPSSPAIPSPPVWTNTGKAQPTKKSMKEIQEDEERRKKLSVKEKETAAATVRRVYSENPIKPSTSVVGGAWTTVGPSGKTPQTTATSRTALTPSSNHSTSGSTPTDRTNGMPPRSSAIQTVKTAPTPTPRSDDSPVAPSHDFLKWLNESLKGLNSSVNVEEIMSMLLSFPMDPDQSTMEIISDLIYANSITLDGRRFAAEFVSKRKVDVASRPKGSGVTGTSTKPVSIADVVKAQPKVTQPEWGGFKVVNKKKKGGRA